MCDLDEIVVYFIVCFIVVVLSVSLSSWSDKVVKNKENENICIENGYVYVDKKCLDVKVVEL